MANRPAAERLTDAQVKQIRRRREAGELLRALAEEYGVATRTIRRRLDAADAARAQRAARAEQRRSRRQPEQAIPLAQGNRPQLRRPPPAPAAPPPLLEHERALRLLTRADLHSANDEAAARAVAAGGGMQAVIEDGEDVLGGPESGDPQASPSERRRSASTAI